MLGLKLPWLPGRVGVVVRVAIGGGATEKDQLPIHDGQGVTLKTAKAGPEGRGKGSHPLAGPRGDIAEVAQPHGSHEGAQRRGATVGGRHAAS